MKKFITALFVFGFVLLSSSSVFASGGEVFPVFRLYNPYSQEHLYTPDMIEVDNLQNHGWRFEGKAWSAPYAEDTDVGVYRLYCHVTGKHLYTTDSSEVANLVDTGIWSLDFNGNPIFGAFSPDSYIMKTPIYRLYNPYSRTHILTKDENEYNVLPAQGWRQEGTAFYEYFA